MSGCRTPFALFAILSAVCLLTTVVNAQPADAPIWPMAGYDLANTCCSPWAGPATNEIAWSVQLADDSPTPLGPASPPVVAADGTVYILAENGALFAVSDQGRLLWRLATNAASTSCPAIGRDGTLYIAENAGGLVAVSPTGALLWRREIPPCAADPVVLPDGRLCLACLDRLLLLHPNGDEVWSFPVEGALRSRPALDANLMAYFGTDACLLYAVDVMGKEVWRVETGGAVEQSPCLAYDGLLYVPTAGANREYGAGDLRVFSLSGEPLRRHHLRGRPRSAPSASERPGLSISAPSPWAETLGHTGPSSTAMLSNGALIYAGGPAVARPLQAANGAVYLAGEHGVLFMGLEQGAIDLSGPAVGFAAGPRTLYAATADGALWAVRDAPPAEQVWPHSTDEDWALIRKLLVAGDPASIAAAVSEIQAAVDGGADAALRLAPAERNLARIASNKELEDDLRRAASQASRALSTAYDSFATRHASYKERAISDVSVPPWEWFDDPEPRVRAFAAENAFPAEETTLRLAGMLRSDPDPTVRLAALRALHGTRPLPDACVAAALAAALDRSETAECRRRALWFLRERLPESDAASQEALLALALDEAESDVLRTEAASLLARRGPLPSPLVDYLIAVAQGPKASRAADAIAVLGQCKDLRDRLAPLMVAAAEARTDGELDGVVALALRDLGGPPEVAGPFVLRLATDADSPAREAALEALPSVGLDPAEALPVLLRALGTGDSPFGDPGPDAQLALRALAGFGPAAEPALPRVCALCATDAQRNAASSALVQIGVASPEVVDALTEAWLADNFGSMLGGGALLRLPMPDDQRVEMLRTALLRGATRPSALPDVVAELLNYGDVGVEAIRELAAGDNGWAASCATEILERIGAAETE